MRSKEFQGLVLEALERLPEEFKARLSNVDVIVQDWPSREQLEVAGLNHPSELLGLYEGVPLTERESYNLVLPDRISIFQRPIEALCRGREEIIREVRTTVAHEIAHHFGIDDDRLEEIGL